MAIPKRPAPTPTSPAPLPKDPMSELDAMECVAIHGHVLEGLPTKRQRISASQLWFDGLTMLKALAPVRASLFAAGLDPALFDDLPIRVALVEATHAIRRMEPMGLDSKANAAVAAAKAYRDEMVRVARFAARKRPDLLTMLAALPSGTSLAHIGEHLRALSYFATSNAALVARVGVDVADLVAKAKVHELAVDGISSSRTLRVKGGRLEVLRRNQAVHHLLEAMREIRDTAIFAFPNDTKLRAVLKGLGARTKRARRAKETRDPRALASDKNDTAPRAEPPLDRRPSATTAPVPRHRRRAEPSATTRGVERRAFSRDDRALDEAGSPTDDAPLRGRPLGPPTRLAPPERREAPVPSLRPTDPAKFSSVWPRCGTQSVPCRARSSPSRSTPNATRAQAGAWRSRSASAGSPSA